jgi:cytidylate kinase
VLDGRDIGTVIAPEAEAKLFVVASVEARALRRFHEMEKSGRPVELARIAADLAERDERDRTRAEAPLRAAEDAMRLDNSALTAEESVSRAIALVEERLRGR